jgi:hypothetical protein
VSGHLVAKEIRFLGSLAACVPANGAIVEIASFKGRSTVMPIDPHNSPILLDHQADSQASSSGFVHSIAWAQFRPEDGPAF